MKELPQLSFAGERNKVTNLHPDSSPRGETSMNVLMLYPKFPEETFWNTARSIKLLWGRKAIMPPLGLLTIASYLPEDFSLRLIDRNVSEESSFDWEWADVIFLSVMMAQQLDYKRCVSQAKIHGKPIVIGGPFTMRCRRRRATMRIGFVSVRQKILSTH
jgi:radical SAM superfamily enzyme YgiQ (UPF0313 family)